MKGGRSMGYFKSLYLMLFERTLEFDENCPPEKSEDKLTNTYEFEEHDKDEE